MREVFPGLGKEGKCDRYEYMLDVIYCPFLHT